MTRIAMPFGAAYDMGKEIWLARLLVPERLRGHGIGTAIVQNLKRHGKPIVLEAEPDAGCKTKLAKFYAALGFKPTGRLRNQLRWTP